MTAQVQEFKVRTIRYLVYGLVAATLLSLTGAGVYAWHEGYRAYAVRTGSMTPTYPAGALVVDAPVRDAAVDPQQVVTFRTVDGLVTHRISGVRADGYETKGDANRAADPWTVPQHNVIGEVVWGSAHLGYLLVYLQQPAGIASLALLAVSVWLAWSIFFPSSSPSTAGHRADLDAPALRGAEPVDDIVIVLPPDASQSEAGRPGEVASDLLPV